MPAVSMEECIRYCTECHRACLETLFTYCMEKGGEHAKASHIRLMADCAEICQTMANFMIRGSEQYCFIIGDCSLICGKCGAACAMMDDERMKACSEVCYRCAHTCMAIADLPS